jgi:tetratricopeptide (TPR) repeat protein
MKKVLILLAIALTANVMMAQKMDRTNAYNYNRNGQYDKAVESIEKCVNHEAFLGMKPKDQAQAWLYRGTIYLNVHQNAEYAAKYPDALLLAYQSLSNCIKADASYAKDNAQEIYPRIAAIAVNYFQDGVENFNNEVYPKAGASFRKSYEISLSGANPDTSALINAALAYQRGGMYEEALTNYQELKDLGYNQVDVYKNLAACYSGMNNDEMSLQMINDGLAKFPGDAGLTIEKVNLYLKQGNGEAAIADLNKLHELDPNNASILFILGTIFGDDTHEIYDSEKAIQYYNQALEVNPEFYDADYNLAALYVNLSNKKMAEANEITGFSKKEIERYNALVKEGDEYLQQGMPYAERAFNAQPSPELGQVLKSIYVRLKMMEEAKNLEERLKEL